MFKIAKSQPPWNVWLELFVLQIKFMCSFNNARSVFGARYMQHIINLLPFFNVTSAVTISAQLAIHFDRRGRYLCCIEFLMYKPTPPPFLDLLEHDTRS